MPLNVMFVDDEEILCMIFVDEFTSAEVNVTAYADPTVAIAAAQKQPPDLLFLDYRMPGTNGDLVAQAMPAAIPKYLITGDIKVNTATAFLGIFAKPLDTEAIRAVIAAALRAKIAKPAA